MENFNYFNNFDDFSKFCTDKLIVKIPLGSFEEFKYELKIRSFLNFDLFRIGLTDSDDYILIDFSESFYLNNLKQIISISYYSQLIKDLFVVVSSIKFINNKIKILNEKNLNDYLTHLKIITSLFNNVEKDTFSNQYNNFHLKLTYLSCVNNIGAALDNATKIKKNQAEVIKSDIIKFISQKYGLFHTYSSKNQINLFSIPKHRFNINDNEKNYNWNGTKNSENSKDNLNNTLNYSKSRKIINKNDRISIYRLNIFKRTSPKIFNVLNKNTPSDKSLTNSKNNFNLNTIQSINGNSDFLLTFSLLNGIKRFYHVFTSNDSLKSYISSSLIYFVYSNSNNSKNGIDMNDIDDTNANNNDILYDELDNPARLNFYNFLNNPVYFPRFSNILNLFMCDGSLILELAHIIYNDPINSRYSDFFKTPIFYTTLVYFVVKSILNDKNMHDTQKEKINICKKKVINYKRNKISEMRYVKLLFHSYLDYLNNNINNNSKDNSLDTNYNSSLLTSIDKIINYFLKKIDYLTTKKVLRIALKTILNETDNFGSEGVFKKGNLNTIEGKNSYFFNKFYNLIKGKKQEQPNLFGFQSMPNYLVAKKNIKIDNYAYLIHTYDFDFSSYNFSSLFKKNDFPMNDQGHVTNFKPLLDLILKLKDIDDKPIKKVIKPINLFDLVISYIPYSVINSNIVYKNLKENCHLIHDIKNEIISVNSEWKNESLRLFMFIISLLNCQKMQNLLNNVSFITTNNATISFAIKLPNSLHFKVQNQFILNKISSFFDFVKIVDSFSASKNFKKCIDSNFISGILKEIILEKIKIVKQGNDNLLFMIFKKHTSFN